MQVPKQMTDTNNRLKGCRCAGYRIQVTTRTSP